MASSSYSNGNPCLEYELDENGRLIGHPCDGFKLTARALVLRRQKWQKSVDKRPPMTQLPVNLRPKYPNDGTPLLHYGFAITDEQIMACARRNGLITDETQWDTVTVRLLALWGVMSFLCRKTRALVYRRDPLSMSHRHMVSLYSNYSIENDEYDEEDEREIIEIIKRELEIPEDVPIMWWWDIDNGPGPGFDHE